MEIAFAGWGWLALPAAGIVAMAALGWVGEAMYRWGMRFLDAED